MLILVISMAFASCSKEDENTFEVTNASGISIYDCKVWFMDSMGGNLTEYENVGNLLSNQTVKVKKHSSYFYIHGRNSNDKSVMSKDMIVSDKVNIYKSNLLSIIDFLNSIERTYNIFAFGWISWNALMPKNS